MKLLFIWPNMDSFGFKPISIALLAAILKKQGHEVEVFDTTFIDFGFKGISETRSKIRIFKPVDFSGHDIQKKKETLNDVFMRKLEAFQPDVVAVSALSDELLIGRNASQIVKQWNPKTPVIWGNKAPTMSPEILLKDKNIDYICLGEGIEFIVEFMQALEKNKKLDRIKNLAFRGSKNQVIKNPLRPYFQDLDSLPFLDWSVFDSRHFLKPFDGAITVGGDHMIQWGCANHCTYCINHAYRDLYGDDAGRFIRRYSVGRIIEELKSLVAQWSITFFKFHDEDFCLKPISYFEELAEKYKREINIPFTAMANARNITPHKVSLLKKMNCVSISIGIETGNERLRREVLKRKETKEQIIEAVKLMNAAEIRTSAFNLLGIPFETRSTIMETIELNRQSEVRYPNTVFFYPLEGTALRKMSLQNGLFREDSVLIFNDSYPTLTLPDISKEELIALRERFNLYVKLPREFHRFIERSERPDPIGKKLTDFLWEIYDSCVFPNDGYWDDRGEKKEHLERLEKLLLEE